MFEQRTGIRALGLILAAVAIAGMSGCSNTTPDPQGGDPVRVALSDTVEDIRANQAQGWGVQIPGLTAAAITEDRATSSAAVASSTASASAPASASSTLNQVVSGSQNPPGQIPLAAGDRFHVGSTTKSFTAALILQLDQEGELSLADPISKWITYPNAKNITVEMLLGHTSGIPNFIANPDRTATDSPQRLVKLSRADDPVFAPGTGWSYSNTNYIMLGIIAEQVTGATWAQEVKARFFDPLELRSTYVWEGSVQPPTVDGSRLNCGYPGQPDCVQQPGFTIIPIADGFDWTVAWAAGAIVSTSADLATWMRNLVAGEVLDPAHRALLTTPTPQSITALSDKPPYGTLRWTGGSLGLLQYKVDGQGTGWGHSGAIDGFVSNVVHMTDGGQTVALTSNFENTDSRAALGDLVIAVDAATPS
ncbi:MAG: D-alanyl-D-alanine carboxypeptidase [Actinomycetes bacterium]|jgi:D-alanyl-D-alanine carboxypeptidase